MAHGLENRSITQVPFQISADLSGTGDGEAPADKHAYQSDLGVLLFVANIMHPSIASYLEFWVATYIIWLNDTPTQSSPSYVT